MGNDLLNATFLDDSEDWFGAGTIGVDETIVGGPGRAVLTASGGDAVSISGPAVTAGQVVEIFGHHAASGGASNLYLKVGGSQILVPQERAGVGAPRRGLPASFAFSYGRVIAPATGTAVLRVLGSGFVYVLKPFLDANPPARRQAWQPGAHTNPDLDLPAWPTDLPLPRPDAIDAKPIPTRKAFSGDSGVPITRRLSLTLRQMVKLGLELNLEERDTLDQFVRLAPSVFWYERPDLAQLCRARWTADGDPDDQGGGVRRRTSLELLLEVA